jgi:agarase
MSPARVLACLYLLVCVLVASALAAPPPPDPGYDAWGGWQGRTTTATGRFRTERIDGVWWLVTPDGHPFYSMGITGVRPDGDFAPSLGTSPYHDNVLARYGTEAAWADVAADRLADLHVNTLGGWSRTALFPQRIAYTEVLNFATRAPIVTQATPSLSGFQVRDWYDPSFDTGAADEAALAAPCAADPWCIGVFSDNEMGWGPGVAQNLPTLDTYMLMAAGAPGKVAVQSFFEATYGTIAAFNAAWGQSFASFADLQNVTSLTANFRTDPPARQADRRQFQNQTATRYFFVVNHALRAVGPDMLILGARFLAYSTSAGVAQAAAPWVDVLSINYYELDATFFSLAQSTAAELGYMVPTRFFDDLDEMARVTGKPLVVSEWTYRAADSGLPNTWLPFFPTLATQADRADAYASYVRRALARPYLLGIHWFKYTDFPAEGRTNGENSNQGITDIHDDLWTTLTDRMRVVNAGVEPQRFLVTGGGKAATDCAIELATSASPGLRCTDGDPRCDRDDVDGQCTVDVLPCVQVTDGRLACTPAMPAGVVVKQPTVRKDPALNAAFAQSLGDAIAAGPGACGRAVTVTIPLGPRRSATAKLSVLAEVPAGRERDTLKLRCDARRP